MRAAGRRSVVAVLGRPAAAVVLTAVQNLLGGEDLGKVENLAMLSETKLGIFCEIFHFKMLQFQSNTLKYKKKF